MQLFNHGPNTRLVLAVSPSKPIQGPEWHQLFKVLLDSGRAATSFAMVGFLWVSGVSRNDFLTDWSQLPGTVPSWRLRIYLITASLASAQSRLPRPLERGDLGRTTALAELTCHSEIRKKGKLIQQTQATRGLFARIISGCNLHHLFAEHTGRGPPNLIFDNHFCYWIFASLGYPQLWTKPQVSNMPVSERHWELHRCGTLGFFRYVAPTCASVILQNLFLANVGYTVTPY